MPIPPTNLLRVFILNVGQADASVIVTPKGNVLLIDVVNASKVRDLLRSLGLQDGEAIASLVITHPHNDHYSGAAAIINGYQVQEAFLAPYQYYTGTPGYHALVNQIEAANVHRCFVSGKVTSQPDGGYPATDVPTFAFLGPTDNVLQRLSEVRDVTPNHLSIITKLTFGTFVMVSAGDAQMENWTNFDQEGLMPQRCDVLKAAHHGSRHGTQCERLERLNATYSIVSSDPEGHHSLPDLVGAATFFTFTHAGSFASLTKDTGTIELRADATGLLAAFHYSELAGERVPFGNAQPLERDRNLTDWAALVRSRLGEIA